MTLRVSDIQSDSDLDSIRNSCDVFLVSGITINHPYGQPIFSSEPCDFLFLWWNQPKSLMKPKSWNPPESLEVDNCNLAFGPLHFIATIEHMIIIKRHISDKGYAQEYVVLKKQHNDQREQPPCYRGEHPAGQFPCCQGNNDDYNVFTVLLLRLPSSLWAGGDTVSRHTVPKVPILGKIYQ